MIKRHELLQKLEEIQTLNDKLFLGSNEADLHTREDIADLFENLIKNGNGKPAVNMTKGMWVTCGDCNEQMTEVRPGKHQCDNPKCARNY